MPLIACGQGRQAYDFIRHVKDVCDKTMPMVGEFSHAVFSLNFLYEELTFSITTGLIQTTVLT